LFCGHTNIILRTLYIFHRSHYQLTLDKPMLGVLTSNGKVNTMVLNLFHETTRRNTTKLTLCNKIILMQTRIKSFITILIVPYISKNCFVLIAEDMEFQLTNLGDIVPYKSVRIQCFYKTTQYPTNQYEFSASIKPHSTLQISTNSVLLQKPHSTLQIKQIQ
ncbi:hypothetical protein STEG23_011853, partial [Scotinomys teguina]